MKIAIAKEVDAAEPRVAATPDTVKKFKALGIDIAIEPGAGKAERQWHQAITSRKKVSPNFSWKGSAVVGIYCA